MKKSRRILLQAYFYKTHLFTLSTSSLIQMRATIFDLFFPQIMSKITYFHAYKRTNLLWQNCKFSSLLEFILLNRPMLNSYFTRSDQISCGSGSTHKYSRRSFSFHSSNGFLPSWSNCPYCNPSGRPQACKLMGIFSKVGAIKCCKKNATPLPNEWHNILLHNQFLWGLAS